ncbi:hypothetical protein DUI70_3223 [Streptomyces albus]|nr:hypothetical protein DUI70_3223 [Streptomyces albus]
MPRLFHVLAPVRRAGRGLRSTATVLVLGAALFLAGAVVLGSRGGPGEERTAASGPGAGRSERGSVAALTERVRQVPKDPAGWAGLGMAYVQQARTTADPATYERAEQALRRSLKVQPRDNYQAQIGMGALAAARHRFTEALDWGRKAAAANPSSAEAQGVLGDAYTQLGRYEESYRAVQRMVDLRPDAGALARASYTWELRGDLPKARELMGRSLRAAPGAPERAFARTHLALLALESGHPREALRQSGAGLRESPRDSGLLEARARTRAALGETAKAVADYEKAIAVAPLPQYLLGLGELREATGDRAGAEEQYALLRAQERVRRSGGGPADVDAILFEADHGKPERAVAMAEQTLRGRPFLAVQDAAAWALHRAGRDTEALARADKALALGTRSALFHHHRAEIHRSLGDPAAARRDHVRALALDPHFHPRYAAEARARLRAPDEAADRRAR